MARAALVVLLLAASTAAVFGGKGGRIWPWQQCGGKGGDMVKFGKDMAMFECVRGSKCERQSEFFWMCVVDKDSSDVALQLPNPGEATCETIVNHAAKRDDLNVFLNIANTTGYLPLLNNVHGGNTVLAPTDDAWMKYSENGVLPSMEILAQLMSYHLLPGRTIKTLDMTNGEILETAKENATITAVQSGASILLQDMTGKTAAIVGENIPLCSAVLQVVGSVLEF